MLKTENERHSEFLRAFTTHEPALRAYIRRLVPAKADADDILQEVAIVLWEKFEEFRPGGNFFAWASGFAKYKSLSWLRDKGREKLVLNTEVVELMAEESPSLEPLLQQQREALERCLGKMPRKDRDLLAQAYQNEVKIHDVALMSGRSVSGFYQWLYRVRQLLHDCIRRELSAGSLS